MAGKRTRRIGSVKGELLRKSREAALAGVQIFNNPSITFKSETYVVLMIIAWTYLLHAYYRDKGIEYRYFDQRGSRKKFHTTKHGAQKYWELERCLNDKRCPVDSDAINNLRFLIGLRHEIEHQMTSRIDDFLSARFQACCLNYNDCLKKLFGDELGIEKHLSFSLQFSTISTDQKELLEDQLSLPANIKGYIQDFDGALSDSEFSSSRYAYRILFVPKLANRRGQADRVIEFVRADSDLAGAVNAEYAVLKETEKPKYRPGQIVEMMQHQGFKSFGMHHHTDFWKSMDAKNPKKNFGTVVADSSWLWYETWVDEVTKHCEANRRKYQ